MKKLGLIIFVLLFQLTTSCKKAVAQEEQQIQLVTQAEMQELIKLKKAQIIDVRTVKEFNEVHLNNAQNIVYDDNFANKLEHLDKTKPVAVYCGRGGRSAKCAKILKEKGFEKIYDLNGGLSKWKFDKVEADN
ncbi:hypothetical protein GCM10009117_22780 [Gangjinia marincola]|uniref:Rhodanese domain-containing protein n=1 Tax=Gangjinia marincola TaxID=578463 RepID=A0ABN1MJ70_9FLAO